MLFRAQSGPICTNEVTHPTPRLIAVDSPTHPHPLMFRQASRAGQGLGVARMRWVQRTHRLAPPLSRPSPATQMRRAVARAVPARGLGGRPDPDRVIRMTQTYPGCGPSWPGPVLGGRSDPARVTRMLWRERGRNRIRISHPTPNHIWPTGNPSQTHSHRRCEAVQVKGRGPIVPGGGKGLRRQQGTRSPETTDGDPTRRQGPHSIISLLAMDVPNFCPTQVMAAFDTDRRAWRVLMIGSD